MDSHSKDPKWSRYNRTELLAYLLKRGHRVKRSTPKSRLIQMIDRYELPEDEEISPSTVNRKRLEDHFKARYGEFNNYSGNNTQLPPECRGKSTQGQCSKHPCSEARRIFCFLENRDEML